MKKINELDSIVYQKALNHVIQHSTYDESVEYGINLILAGKGNKAGCLRSLRGYAEANAIVAWFRDNDLLKFKEWSFIEAKLKRMVLQCNPNEWFPAYEFFHAILSDQQEIISWYTQFKLPYCSSAGAIKDRDNPKRSDFHGYQILLALNGEWDELRQRCELILSLDLKKDKKYLIDHRFYLALANGDQREIENVLTELTSPKIAKVRNYEFAFTFTEHFISTFATLYAKLAWMSGYEVQIDTPYIPKEWLPITPLNSYPEPWKFMQDFEIFTPLDEPWQMFSPKVLI
ncbi:MULTISPECIES: Imm49 family immunity protein [Acinetobacter]|uniref:Imm49 family immunity protein n=1 Tax=Acinetobacter TaxID=469 RepID=UPI00141BA1CE|nr:MULTISPECIES: Imm49 family immunity protein [Acinetobacter]MCS4300149.1 hypothetical protein [Acinetobacter guillouiae]MCW2251303.1 hypothetical protein [Acinetobacter sp. BIGb0204]NII36199.1 hypothetical protein [Acinetobacter sp. BIGb0196]